LFGVRLRGAYRSGYDFKRLFTLSEFYDRDRPAFYAAIQGVRDNNMDLTGWLEYFVTGLATQMQETQKHGRHIIKADIVAREHGLNERQQELLLYCMEVAQPSIIGIDAAFPDVTRRTLQRDLNRLVETGMLRVIGHTNDRHYTLP
jgi:Fic family protein